MLNGTENYIIYDREHFQQVAKEEYYRAEEKLIYKFISNYPVVAYDDKGRLTLNSANIVIPKLKGLNMKMIAAILNSDVVRYYYSKKFNTCKIIRKDMEDIPIITPDKIQAQELNVLIDKLFMGNTTYDALNDYIYQLYRLDEEDIKYIKQVLYHSI
jgi:hypothetical protein